MAVSEQLRKRCINLTLKRDDLFLNTRICSVSQFRFKVTHLHLTCFFLSLSSSSASILFTYFSLIPSKSATAKTPV